MIHSTQAPVVGGAPQIPKPSKGRTYTKRPGDPRIDPFGPEGHALCGRGTSRAKWATAGVLTSSRVDCKVRSSSHTWGDTVKPQTVSLVQPTDKFPPLVPETWSGSGVFFSTFVFFIVPVSLG